MQLLTATRRLWRKFVRRSLDPMPAGPVESTRAPTAPPPSGPSPLARMTDSLEQTPENEPEIVGKLLASYTAARERLPSVSRAYLPAPGWGRTLDAEWRGWREVIERGDAATLACLLRNFFRNECISGLWGGDRMFQVFRDAEENASSFRPAMMLAQFHAWRRVLPTVPVEDLNAPRIGNPWGYVFGGNVLYEPVFEYNYQAHYFRTLLSHLRAPVVLEIGGGFGGLASHILKLAPSTKYIGFDLPENTLVQAYYLSCAFPHARVLVYDRNTATLSPGLLDAHDIVLMPNFMLPQVPSRTADLIVNSRSLSEMSSETIEEYLRQIDRIGRLWFFHENIFKERGDGIPSIPSSQFPRLANHTLVAASESRWPRYNSASAYPCQENLFLHRSVLMA
jgi:putative sugar O-methyltransferase